MAGMAENGRNQDTGLVGNEKIEEYIGYLQQEPTQEMLAVTLTAIRRRMKAGGQFVIAVSPNADKGLAVQLMQLPDGKRWAVGYTGFAEQEKGSQPVVSTFLADMREVLTKVLAMDGVSGLIINPWNRTLYLEKPLIRLILGE
ncbi:MAG: SseB family protein [Lachnospiraceae bacterium]|nr:SseB family protein [Lachnospiraceae bacterium]MCH4070121.1 SseB family protein [Lachnospiraceae bacterium]MCH4108527.1 SseB family protein [Lachnospiraceae bacterium]MCI1302646.1 SseB family protein [Lachnospiraceae bacterium]MCI1331830.1 SseB family protein [Lachnospiraceae bacterium]